MTNADKFLKDGISVEELADEIAKAIEDRILMYSSDKNTRISRDSAAIYEFFNESVKSTLTEDEKVILRNIKDKQKVIFNDGSNLWTRDVEKEDNFFGQFNHLFQFIKERRRI